VLNFRVARSSSLKMPLEGRRDDASLCTRSAHSFTDRLRIVVVVLLRLYIGLHKLRRDQAYPYAPVGSIPETSSALRRWLPAQSNKARLQQKTQTLQLVSALPQHPHPGSNRRWSSMTQNPKTDTEEIRG
jgi:hypothetical protein